MTATTIVVDDLPIGSGSVLDIETYASTYGRATHESGSTSAYARCRDAAALARSADGYTRESVHLARAYDHALGWALAYGIRTYEVTATGVYLRALGDLRADVTAFEAPLIEAQKRERARRDQDAEVAAILARIDAAA